jgi:hypothetical protein
MLVSSERTVFGVNIIMNDLGRPHPGCCVRVFGPAIYQSNNKCQTIKINLNINFHKRFFDVMVALPSRSRSFSRSPPGQYLNNSRLNFRSRWVSFRAGPYILRICLNPTLTNISIKRLSIIQSPPLSALLTIVSLATICLMAGTASPSSSSYSHRTAIPKAPFPKNFLPVHP